MSYLADFFPSSATTNATSAVLSREGNSWQYHASIIGSGAVSVTVTVQVSNDGTNWETFATMSLSGTNSDTDNASGNAPWRLHRVALTSISGTAAAVRVVGYGV